MVSHLKVSTHQSCKTWNTWHPPRGGGADQTQCLKKYFWSYDSLILILILSGFRKSSEDRGKLLRNWTLSSEEWEKIIKLKCPIDVIVTYISIICCCFRIIEIFFWLCIFFRLFRRFSCFYLRECFIFLFFSSLNVGIYFWHSRGAQEKFGSIYGRAQVLPPILWKITRRWKVF